MEFQNQQNKTPLIYSIFKAVAHVKEQSESNLIASNRERVREKKRAKKNQFSLTQTQTAN